MHNCDAPRVSHERERGMNNSSRRVLFPGRHRPAAPPPGTAGGADTKGALVAGHLGNSRRATAVAVVGIAVGAPGGIAVGRVLWRVFATNFGVVPVAVVEPVLIAALAAGVLAAANLLAAVPALLAARSHPAWLLRAE